MNTQLAKQPYQPYSPAIETFPSFVPKKLMLNGKEIILTKRESECLSYLAQGKTAKETAREMGLSNRTVEAYLENIKLKSNLRNKLSLLSHIR